MVLDQLVLKVHEVTRAHREIPALLDHQGLLDQRGQEVMLDRLDPQDLWAPLVQLASLVTQDLRAPPEMQDNKAVLDQLEQPGKADPLGKQELPGIRDNKELRVPEVVKVAPVSLALLDQQASGNFNEISFSPVIKHLLH